MKNWILALTCAIAATLSANNPHITHFEEGAAIPFSIVLDGELLQMDISKDNLLTIRKGFYVQSTPEGPLLSSDGVEWKPLLEYIKGNITLNIDDQTPSLALDVLIHERENLNI